jgi:hypothetical protein
MKYSDLTYRQKYVEEVCHACNIVKRISWYKKCSDCLSKSIHCGRYKLLLSTIQFLDLALPETVSIVYVGSAPFVYGKILSEMYPNTRFILFDPKDHKFEANSIAYCNEVHEINDDIQFNIFQKAFDSDICIQILNKFGANSLLFMSDIRCSEQEPTNIEVKRDLELQKEWVTILRPKMFWLKFRCLFGVDEPMEYLDGDLYLQPFTPDSSAECRLVGTNISPKIYDPIEYEEKLCYYNNHLRPKSDFDIEKSIIINHFGDITLSIERVKHIRRELGVSL